MSVLSEFLTGNVKAFRWDVDSGRRICYNQSNYLAEGRKKTQEMDEGDSTNGNQPPLYHMSDWIGHGLYLRE